LTATAPSTASARLPLWRLIAGILVLTSLAGVLLALAPVYFADYQLRQYVRSLALDPKSAGMPDDGLRTAVIARARQLDLPVQPADIQISHAGGKLHLQLKYAVQMDFPLYQVEVHFHTNADSP
jgi:hypothetical protein